MRLNDECAIKSLCAKNSISDMPRTWNLHNFCFISFEYVFSVYRLFINFCISLLYLCI